MLVYKCTKCDTIFRFSSILGPSESRCTKCGKQIVWVSQDKDTAEGQLIARNQRKAGLNWPFLLDAFETLGIAWGVGGAVNLASKYIKNEEVGNRGLAHVVVPSVLVSIINRLDPRNKSEGQAPSLQPQVKEIGDPYARVREVLEQVKKLGSIETSPVSHQVLKETKEDVSLPRSESTTPQQRLTPARERQDMAYSRVFLWLEILSRYPVILILGAKGTGKFFLAFYLLEIMRYRGPCYVYRLPEKGKRLIPPWLGILQELADAPAGSIILVDEAYLSFFSRDSQSGANKEITRIVNLTRQKNICLIFVAHESRHLEKNILSGIDTLISKKPAPLQIGLDRSFLKPYLLKAQKAFEGKNEAACKSLSYVCFSPSGFEGTLENGKATFWSEELSHIFASGHQGRIEVPAKEMSREEKKKRAQKLHDFYHHSYGEISKELGAAKTTVYRWVNENREGGTS